MHDRDTQPYAADTPKGEYGGMAVLGTEAKEMLDRRFEKLQRQKSEAGGYQQMSLF